MNKRQICHKCMVSFTLIEDHRGFMGCSCGTRIREKRMIELDDYLSASGKYPQRLQDVECTEEVKNNAIILLNKINQLLVELGITSIIVSSGFRPSSVNANTPGSAKRSLHMIGLAIDLVDIDNDIYNKILTNHQILDKYKLWLESKDSTPNWCHLDLGIRSERKIRIFIP